MKVRRGGRRPNRREPPFSKPLPSSSAALARPFAPASPEDLLELGRRLYASFRRNELLVRAQTAAGFASEVRTLRRKARVEQIRAVLNGIGAPRAPTDRATAVIAHLASAEAGLPMLDVYGLDRKEAEQAALQAINAVIEDLRSHAAADSAVPRE